MAKKTTLKVKKAVREYVAALKKEIPVERVVLFGSRAKNSAGRESDIDLAIVSSVFGKNPQADGKYLIRKLWEVKYSRIDPIGYSPRDFRAALPSPLLCEIRKHGREIKV